MEHYRSVYATAALLIFGLGTASHIAYPREPAEDRPRVKATRSIESAWIDPPQLRVATLDAVAPARPAMFTLLAPETVALFSVASEAKPARVAAVRRQRVARLPTRAPATAGPGSPAAIGVDPSESTPPEKAAQIDLIGDLIHNLGLGRDS